MLGISKIIKILVLTNKILGRKNYNGLWELRHCCKYCWEYCCGRALLACSATSEKNIGYWPLNKETSRPRHRERHRHNTTTLTGTNTCDTGDSGVLVDSARTWCFAARWQDHTDGLRRDYPTCTPAPAPTQRVRRDAVTRSARRGAMISDKRRWLLPTPSPQALTITCNHLPSR